MKPRTMLPCILLAVVLGGCSADVDVSPDKAYCELAGQTARIIDVRINKAQISMEKGTPQDAMLVGDAIDAIAGGVVGAFRVDLKKGKCVVTTSSDGKSATYKLKPSPAQK